MSGTSDHHETVRFLKSVLIFSLSLPLVSNLLGMLTWKMMHVFGLVAYDQIVISSAAELIGVLLLGYVFLIVPAAVLGPLVVWNELRRTRLYYVFLILLAFLASVFLPLPFLDSKDMTVFELRVGGTVAFVSAVLCWLLVRWFSGAELEAVERTR